VLPESASRNDKDRAKRDNKNEKKKKSEKDDDSSSSSDGSEYVPIYLSTKTLKEMAARVNRAR
jgi:hypothetical protein